MGGRLLKFVTFVMLSALFSIPARADYTLSPGDFLELSVAGVPDLRSTMRVDIDGMISVPLVGELKAAGQTVAEVRKAIRASLEGKFLRQVNMTGVDYQVTFEPEKIAVNIAEYRPIYVMGDVARAGEVAYRPGMSAQQAIALAGGYDIVRFRTVDPVLQSADLRGEYQNLWIQLAREQARIDRIRSELGLEAQGGEVDQSPIPSSTLGSLRSNEDKVREMRDTERKNEFGYIDKSLDQAKESLDTVIEQKEKEQQGVQNDSEEVDRLSDMEKRGNTTSARVVEARRALLLSSTRLLQTMAQASQIRLQETELERRKSRFDETRGQEMLRDLQESIVRVETLKNQLQAAGEKLVHATALRSQLTHSGLRPPLIIVTRRGPSGVERIEAKEDTVLMSGDTVDVRLSTEPTPGAEPER